MVAENLTQVTESRETQAVSNSKETLGSEKLPIMAYAFMVLIEALETRQTSVKLQADQVLKNAHYQTKINKLAASIKFDELNEDELKKMSEADRDAKVAATQNHNKILQTDKQNLQNILITARQKGQREMTEAGTTVNMLEQDCAGNVSVLSSMHKLYTLINEMSSR